MKDDISCLFHIFLPIFFVSLANISCQKPIVAKKEYVNTLAEINLSSRNDGENNLAPPTSIFEDKMDGMTMVAPPKPFTSDPFIKMKAIDINWVGVIPYAYTPQGNPKVSFGTSSWQWWGETVEGATESIKQAHANELLVMLKPQVYIPGSWPGGMTFKNESEWLQWETDYEKYILTFARIAAEQEVALFCIGTEFKMSSIGRPEYWESLILKIKEIYSGKLTYAANWDEYNQITFWDKLDFIGVDAYFPLTDEAVPSVESLVSFWAQYEREIKKVSDKYDRPILFTEYGYMSVEGCAGKTWVLEADRSILKYNEQAQANAFDAIYEVFFDKEYWAGGFIWKWYPGEFAGKKRMHKDYTPQNKIGEGVLAKWYKKTLK